MLSPAAPSTASVSPWPAWAKKAARSGTPAEDLVSFMGELYEAVMGKPSTSLATFSRSPLALWKALEFPPLAEFKADCLLVVEAAQQSPNPLFARDIRGVGWAGAPDRSRDITTMMVQARWDARLAAAKAWARPGLVETEPEEDDRLFYDWYQEVWRLVDEGEEEYHAWSMVLSGVPKDTLRREYRLETGGVATANYGFVAAVELLLGGAP